MSQDVSVGIIRPIDPKEGFIDSHFQYLESELAKKIDSCSDDRYTYKSFGLVSRSNGVADISRTLVKNIFLHDIIVVFVSGLNPNVMFELGLRLSQKKPTIIISDNETNLPFDINSIYTLFYPRNLNAPELENFYNEFQSKFKETWEKFVQNNGADTFIAAFDESTVINTKVNNIDFNEAVTKLASMIDIMKRKYVAFDPNDTWDDFNFEHDLASPIPLDNDSH